MGFDTTGVEHGLGSTGVEHALDTTGVEHAAYFDSTWKNEIQVATQVETWDESSVETYVESQV